MPTDPPPNTQKCPICHAPLAANPRYPNHLCGSCASQAVDSDGRALAFYNSSLPGGFEAHFKEDDSFAVEVTKSHVAFVKGTRLWADEARFGGIVIVPHPEDAR